MRKIFIILLIIGVLIFCFSIVTASPWNISSATYTQNLSLGSTLQSNSQIGLFLNSSGTGLYLSNPSSDLVYQYSLSTPWNISSATYTGQNFNVGSQETSAQGLFLNSSGTAMYIYGFSDLIYQYSLSTPWNISSATYTGQNFTFVNAEDFFFNSSGTAMYILDNGRIYQYSLSTPWNISSATYTQNLSLRFADYIFFNSSGTGLYLLSDGVSDLIYQYSLSTPWNISSATYTGQNFTLNFTEGGRSSGGFSFDSIGQYFYVASSIGGDTDFIYQYELLHPPSIVLDIGTELNNSFLNRNNIFINVSALIKDISPIDSISINLFNFTFYLINYSNSNSSPYSINFTNLSDGIYYFNATVNDTSNSLAFSDTRTVTIDTLKPQISFGINSESNNSYLNRSNIYINLTLIEINEANTTFSLSNLTSLINTTTKQLSQRTINFTNLSDGIYYFNATSIDNATNSNSTPTRTVTIDTLKPVLTILRPQPIYYVTNMSLALNFTAIDTNLYTCWYNIKNSTNTQIISTNLSNCQNTTFNLPRDDNYVLTLFANDSAGNENSTNVSFSISMNAPTVVLDYPSNNFFFNSGTNRYFNFTATDSDGLSTCQLYSNLGGTFSVNYTWISPTNATQNFTSINITQSDGSYIWNVRCNDSAGNINFALNNFTFTKDTISPKPSIISISPTNGNLNVPFTSNYTELNCNNSFYSVFDISSNIHNSLENISLSCGNMNSTFSILSFGSYNLKVYVRDSAGNENSTIQSFTVLDAVGGSGGGGGGGSSTTEKIPVIGISVPESTLAVTTVYTSLEKEIIYAIINQACADKIAGTLAIIDYSKDCSLNNIDLTKVKTKLSEKQIKVSDADLLVFYQNYKQGNLFQGFESQATIKAHGLFTAVLGLTNELRLNPPNIDTPKLIPSTIPGNITLIVFSNKPIKSCEVLTNNGFTCRVTNSTIQITYENKDLSFFSKIVTNSIIVTTDAEPDKIEQKKIPIVLRLYNPYYKLFNIQIIYIILTVIPLLLLLSYYFIKTKRFKKLNKAIGF